MSCSYCYGHGHNRVGCSERKTRVATLRASGDKLHYLVREDDRRQNNNQRRSTVRTCSWCRKTGHNRRSCRELKGAKTKYVSLQAAYRQRLFEDMKERGLGIGSLVTFSPRWYSYDQNDYVREPILYMVTGVFWDSIRWTNLYGGFTEYLALEAVSVDRTHNQQKINIEYPGVKGVQKVPNGGWGNDWEKTKFQLLSPVSGHVIESAKPSSDWFDGLSGIKYIFDKDLESWEPNNWFSKLGELAEYDFLEKA